MTSLGLAQKHNIKVKEKENIRKTYVIKNWYQEYKKEGKTFEQTLHKIIYYIYKSLSNQ